MRVLKITGLGIINIAGYLVLRWKKADVIIISIIIIFFFSSIVNADGLIIFHCYYLVGSYPLDAEASGCNVVDDVCAGVVGYRALSKKKRDLWGCSC